MANEALASETYNPTRSPDVDELYGIMNASVPTEDLMVTYREMVTSLPTANPYEGVLVNPRACEVDQANSDLDEIIEEIKNNPDFPPTVPDHLEDAQDALDQYKEHTDRLIANFPTVSSIVQSEIGNNVSAYGSNPCLGFGDIMGSVLDAGRDIMNEIIAAIANIKENLQAALDLIKDLVAKLMAAIAKAMTQMLEEIEKMAKSMLNMSKMNLAQMMKFQMKDPCLKQILGGMLTSSAANILGG